VSNALSAISSKPPQTTNVLKLFFSSKKLSLKLVTIFLDTDVSSKEKKFGLIVPLE
jgi:hypothetical protein